MNIVMRNIIKRFLFLQESYSSKRYVANKIKLLNKKIYINTMNELIKSDDIDGIIILYVYLIINEIWIPEIHNRDEYVTLWIYINKNITYSSNYSINKRFLLGSLLIGLFKLYNVDNKDVIYRINNIAKIIYRYDVYKSFIINMLNKINLY